MTTIALTAEHAMFQRTRSVGFGTGADARLLGQQLVITKHVVADGRAISAEHLIAPIHAKMEEHALDQTHVSVTCIIMAMPVSSRNLVTTKDWNFFFSLTLQEVSANLTSIFLKRL